jgi:hypothetical protein
MIINNLIAQVIPDERHVDWNLLVQHINIKKPVTEVNVMDFGAAGNGLTDDKPAVMDAIAALNGKLGYVFFPAGNYLIEGQIAIPDSCVLKGAGSNSSMLIFNMGEEPANCISVSKAQTTDFVGITNGFQKGSNLIAVADASSFGVGDYVEIRQENGSWDVVPASWAEFSVGQITKVSEVNGNTIKLESPLRIDYDADLNPEIRPITPISNAGLQCIKIKRIDEPEEGGGSNIYFSMAANCMVRGVESDSSVGSHVSINTSVNILVDGSYFHHAFTYDGASTRGYGVTLSHHSSECLITNNIYKYLRHAMMVKTGANGNVISYNYSIEPHRTEQIPDASGDMIFHGHFAYSNLMEGNIVQNIVFDHYWGPSGPYNTIFRNRAELYGIIMTTGGQVQSNMQNFVGNEVTNTSFLHGLYMLNGNNQFQFGNNIRGDIIPADTDTLSDISYYLTTPPYFWSSSISWPSVGEPNVLNTGTIPAQVRYQNASTLTSCPDSVSTAIHYNSAHNSPIIKIWPNPAHSVININPYVKYNGHVTLKLTNMVGTTMLTTTYATAGYKVLKLHIENIPPGIYTLNIKSVNYSLSKIVVIQ